MTREISQPRKAAYYIGGAMMVAGFLLFMSTFFIVPMKGLIFGKKLADRSAANDKAFKDFERKAQEDFNKRFHDIDIAMPSDRQPEETPDVGESFFGEAHSTFLMFGVCGAGGMILMISGIFVRNVGKMGLAGSGVILDPAKARQEVEPFSRMAGGVVKDVLDEADIKIGSGGKSERVVVIKCAACGTLNDQDAKFCKFCGQKI